MKKIRKNFIDPITSSTALGILAMQGMFQATVGWITLKLLEHVWKDHKPKKGDDEKPDDTGISGKEQK